MWQDADRAREVLQALARLKQSVDEADALSQSLEDNAELLELARSEGDEPLIEEALAQLSQLSKQAERHHLEALFDDPMDGNDCYIEIHAGAGGTESQDWAAMLLRMYLRWAKQHDYRAAMISEMAGEEAGIKSAAVKIIGLRAYGWLKGEQGTHRFGAPVAI